MIDETYDKRIERLPRWAQDRIKVLEADLEYASKELRETLPGGDSRIAVRLRGLLEGSLVNVPTHSVVSFCLGKNKDEGEIQVRIAEDSRGRWLDVRSGFNGITVEPDSSNVIRVHERVR